MKALQGLKVLDLTSALSGPFCTMILADYGADVLKIEPPGGEMGRGLVPIDPKSGESGCFCNWNRNKKGVTLNLKNEKARQFFYEMVRNADVVVENYKGGVTKRLQIDYETLYKINPKIIYASGSGFGQYGPLAERPCFDSIAQAMGGILNLTGYPDGKPVKVGPSVADHVSGIYLATGILLALYHRAMTGEGQQVDVSMVDTIFSILESAVVDYTMNGEIAKRSGNVDMIIAPFDVYECRDGYITIGVGNDRQFGVFCDVIGRPWLKEDPRYKTNSLRHENYIPDLQKVINDWCSERTKKEVEAIMAEASIPCGPLLNMKEIIESSHIKAREMVVPCRHPLAGDMKLQGCVMKLSRTPGSVEQASPLLGQDNLSVFGLTVEQLEQFKMEGIM